LSELTFSKWSAELRDYVKGNPIISTLFLEEQQQPILDFRGTGLMKITLNAEGVQEIYLNDIMETLRLHGALEPGLVVHDPHKGAFITLTVDENQMIPPGLDCLRGLWINGIKNADLALTIGKHREITTLRLWGEPGTITNLPVIGSLKKLDYLTTKEIFGFTGAEFPPPEALPSLSTLWLTSLPHEAAQTIKKKYQVWAKNPDCDLSVRQGRKPDWLAANMDNPFRAWDGDDMVPPHCAKKAADIYRKTRLEMQKAVAAESPQEACERLCKAYIEVFNTMDKKQMFIDTVFRENIIEALDTIVTDVVAESGTGVDAARLMDVCEGLRDF
jgi:hypothetical protein